MSTHPHHKSYEYIPRGVVIKRFYPTDNSIMEGALLHSDDYYIFGFLESGDCMMQVDFYEHSMTAKQCLVVLPGQLHRLRNNRNAKGFAIMIDCSFITEEQSKLLFAFARSENFFNPPLEIVSALEKFIPIISEVISTSGELSNLFKLHIGQALVELFCCGLNSVEVIDKGRYNHHAATFFALLSKNVVKERRASFYSNAMKISLVYLNEAVKAVTGKSVTQNLNEEIVLRAKRMLAFSKLSVKEISCELGFNDHAYFTRLFTKIAGCSPSTFRKNLE